MALTVKRRNEIAWWCLVYKISKKGTFPLKSLSEYCVEVSQELGIENNKDLQDLAITLIDTIFSNTLKGVWVEKTPSPVTISEAKRNSMAWEILVRSRFKEGLRLREGLRREIGTMAGHAKPYGISKEEMFEFVRVVITEVCYRTLNDLQRS